MQVLVPSRPARSGRVLPSIAIGVAVGMVLFGGGLLLGYLTLGTSFLDRFAPHGRPSPIEMAEGAVAWSLAFSAPALFMIVGVAKLFGTAERMASLRPRPTPIRRLAASLPDDYVAAARVRLPDGRSIPELVLGPFGVAVIEQLPPVGATRRRGTSWEVRVRNGRWAPLENPLDRCARDAERVRRWLSSMDQDFVVKVYAAIMAPDGALERTPGCAVVTDAQLPAWLASLPGQRSLTESRREHVLELIREGV